MNTAFFKQNLSHYFTVYTKPIIKIIGLYNMHKKKKAQKN